MAQRRSQLLLQIKWDHCLTSYSFLVEGCGAGTFIIFELGVISLWKLPLRRQLRYQMKMPSHKLSVLTQVDSSRQMLEKRQFSPLHLNRLPPRNKRTVPNRIHESEQHAPQRSTNSDQPIMSRHYPERQRKPPGLSIVDLHTRGGAM